MTVRGIIAAAYGAPQPLPLFRVIGGPGWIDSDRYDVEAIATSDAALSLIPPWPSRGQAMLRALMMERFKLSARQETRDVPAYDLMLANKDRALGRGLKERPAQIASIRKRRPQDGRARSRRSHAAAFDLRHRND